MGPSASMDGFGTRTKSLLPPVGIQTTDHPARSLVTLLNTLSWFALTLIIILKLGTSSTTPPPPDRKLQNIQTAMRFEIQSSLVRRK